MSNDRYRTIKKEYVELSCGGDGKYTHIEVDMYYDKGDYYLYKSHGRGFYVRISPVWKRGNWVTTIPYEGQRIRLATVGRYTKSGEADAQKILDLIYDKEIRAVCEKFGLTVKKDERMMEVG